MSRVPSARERLSLGLAFVVFALGASGCSHVQPWQRARLAHPTMVTSTFAGPAVEHMYGVHEGAVGGGSVAESGCGCN